MIKLLDSFSTSVIRKPQTAPSYPKPPTAEASVKFSVVFLTDGPENKIQAKQREDWPGY